MEQLVSSGELTAEKLRSVIRYDKETGEFFRILKGGKLRPVARGGLSEYTIIRIDDKKYKAHRLAWLYTYGAWPDIKLAHANGDKTDNRIDNLVKSVPTPPIPGGKYGRD